MEHDYNVPVLPVNCLELGEAEIKNIIETVLFEFPVREIKVNLPDWISALDMEHWLHSSIYGSIRGAAQDIDKIRQVRKVADGVQDNEYVDAVTLDSVDLGRGTASMTVTVKPGLFYKVLGETTGLEINGEGDLITLMTELAKTKREYDKVRGALDEVNATGYGIVMPSVEDLSLEKPEIVRQGGRYGVRLKASSQSIHMLKCRVVTEINPLVGSEQQSQELVNYLLKQFEEEPEKIWESDIFGKSLHDLVTEGLHNKLYRMPADARMKLQETLERIINEGCSGLICIIL
jgi:stage IV sporulation protein A